MPHFPAAENKTDHLVTDSNVSPLTISFVEMMRLNVRGVSTATIVPQDTTA